MDMYEREKKNRNQKIGNARDLVNKRNNMMLDEDE